MGEKEKKIIGMRQIMGEKKYWQGDNGEKRRKKILACQIMREKEKKNIAMEIPSHFQITNLFIAGGHLSPTVPLEDTMSQLGPYYL